MNVTEYQMGVVTFYVYASADDGAKVYKPCGNTTDPVEMADHDGVVLYDGNVIDVVDENGILEAYHDWMGKTAMPTWSPDDTLAEPAILLKRMWGRTPFTEDAEGRGGGA